MAKAGHITGRVAVYTTLIVGLIVFLFPLYWLVLTSLKPVEKTMELPPDLRPRYWQFSNYLEAITYQQRVERIEPPPFEIRQTGPWIAETTRQILDYVPFIRYTLNTIFICVLSVTGVVLGSSLAAYGFARLRWPGRNLLFGLTIATMMVPFPVLMVQQFAIFRWLGWIGTFRPLWVPAWFGTAFNIFLLRQFFLTIPQELSDAARVDGCSEWRIFWTVILPLSKPVLAVVALFQFLYCWKDFLGPWLYLTHQRDFTLSLALQFYQSKQGGTEWHLLMAAAVLVVLPVLVLFFAAQRTFIQGIKLTGLKG